MDAQYTRDKIAKLLGIEKESVDYAIKKITDISSEEREEKRKSLIKRIAFVLLLFVIFLVLIFLVLLIGGRQERNRIFL